jgi:hypothetical protein
MSDMETIATEDNAKAFTKAKTSFLFILVE